MSSTSGSWRMRGRCRSARSWSDRCARRVSLAAVVAVPDRNAVAPPELAADAPVADVLQPVQVDAGPAIRDTGAGGRRGPRQWPAPPAAPSARTTAATGTARSTVSQRSQRRTGTRYGSVLTSRPCASRSATMLLARLEAVEPGVAAAVVVDAPVGVHDDQRRQAVALAHLEVVGVVRRRHLHRAGAERRVDQRVGDDRNRPVHQRQDDAACRAGRW